MAVLLAVFNKKGDEPNSLQTTEENPIIPATVRPVLPDETPSTKTYQKAMDAFVDQNFAEAVPLFEQLLSLNPELNDKILSPYTKALLGLAGNLRKSDSERSIQLYKKALQLNPNNEKAHFQLGMVLMEQKDYAAATSSFENVISLTPEFPDAFFNLGYISTLSKNYSRAEEMYARVVELRPEYLDEALFNLALVQKKLNKINKSRANLEKAVKVNPNNKLAQKYLKRIQGVSGE